MMNWIQERSKDYYDDYGDQYPPSPLLEWKEIPRLLILLFLAPCLALGGICMAFHIIAKETMDHGKLEYPGLTYAGVILGLILAAGIPRYEWQVSVVSVLLVFSTIFVVLFALAPLTGFCLRFVRNLSGTDKKA